MASSETGEGTRARRACLVAGLILLAGALLAAVGLARPASAQEEAGCRTVSAAQYQYQDCDEDTTNVVPPGPEPPRPEPPEPQPGPKPPGGGGVPDIPAKIVIIDKPNGSPPAKVLTPSGATPEGKAPGAAVLPGRDAKVIVGVDAPAKVSAPSATASASAAATTAPTVSASAPGDSAVAEGGVSEATVLPDTGGVAPIPLLAAALLLGMGVLAGGRILRSR